MNWKPFSLLEKFLTLIASLVAIIAFFKSTTSDPQNHIEESKIVVKNSTINNAPGGNQHFGHNYYHSQNPTDSK